MANSCQHLNLAFENKGKTLLVITIVLTLHRAEETGSLQVANTMRLVLLNVSLHVLVIKSLQETQ